MICALVFVLGCQSVVGSAPEGEAQAVVATKGTLRSCLRVAGGLKKTAGGAAASAHVQGCYEQHFAPMKAMIREQNSKAALSLEYGFGLLAHAMSNKRADADAHAAQLADRVDAVLASLQLEAPPAPQSPIEGDDRGGADSR